jgi:hypothetical protein
MLVKTFAIATKVAIAKMLKLIPTWIRIIDKKPNSLNPPIPAQAGIQI